ncbi:MAG: hypothetical protein QCI38_06220, partial [Candidatus Thermoplasmatota archaeon]|nr:hypothetical protein [Candidatus Thermoplasmatota archaeon]
MTKKMEVVAGNVGSAPVVGEVKVSVQTPLGVVHDFVLEKLGVLETVTFVLPWFPETGVYIWSASIDPPSEEYPDGDVLEGNENNNVVYRNVEVILPYEDDDGDGVNNLEESAVFSSSPFAYDERFAVSTPTDIRETCNIQGIDFDIAAPLTISTGQLAIFDSKIFFEDEGQIASASTGLFSVESSMFLGYYSQTPPLELRGLSKIWDTVFLGTGPVVLDGARSVGLQTPIMEDVHIETDN